MKLFRNPTFLALALLVILGFSLRLFSFGSITFGYDQARDAIVSYNIWKGDLKILGPISDIAGLHHGILYWYLISPLYFFSNHNIYIVKLFLVLSSLIVIPVSYILSQKMFHNKGISFFTAFLCACSFELIQYSHWLSNPSLAVVTISLSFLFLWMYVSEGKRYALLLTAFFWGLSVHFEIFLLYQLAVFLVILIIFRKFKIADIALAVLIALLVLSPFFLAEVRFDFIGIKGITAFFKGYAGSRGQTYSEMFERGWGKLVLVPYYNELASLGASYVLTVSLILASIYSLIARKDKKITFLFLWIISPFLLFFVGSTNIYFVFVGISIPLSLLFSYYTYNLLIVKKAYIAFYILILIVLGSNIFLLYQFEGQGETLFSVQSGMVLSDEKSAIDWIYAEADGKPFRIDTITNPLLINTTWAYLFDWYGRQKYGYVPFWWGYPQNGQYGEDITLSSDFKGSQKIIFLIIEPTTGIPDFYLNAVHRFEDTRSKVVVSKKFGQFIVEKRLITQDKPFSKEEIDTDIKTNDLRSVHLEGFN